MVAYLNIDEVIRIVRTEDKPKLALIKRFKLSELQSDAILDLRLRQLAKLEEIKIQGEMDELNSERLDLEKVIASKARLKTLLKKEILADAELYGDERRSPVVQRPEAQVFKEKDLLSTEPITVVLSEKGWIRAAKGHDVDAAALSYRSGDSFLYAQPTKSNQDAVFLDSTGRAYTIACHTLPSTRGQGEPLTGRINPPSGAFFTGLVTGDKDQQYLVSSDAGYGFVATVGDMMTKNKAGKSLLTVPQGGIANQPAIVTEFNHEDIAAFSNEGRLLIFPVSDMPVMGRGKGVKIMNIPQARVVERIEMMRFVRVFSEVDTLVVYSGKRFLKLKIKDLEHYLGERARRGMKLPRGFQNVDSVTIDRGDR